MTESNQSGRKSPSNIHYNDIRSHKDTKEFVNIGMKNDETEYQTRKKRIDIRLLQAGWNPNDINKVIQEVDTKNSIFVSKNYKTKSDTLKTEEEKAYADYLLLDGRGNPLAIVEAKTLYPIHTEHPEAYKAVSKNMILVQEGKKYEL